MGIAGVGHHRPEQQQEGLFQLSFFAGEDAEFVEEFGVLGLPLQQGFQQLPGFIEPALLQERDDKWLNRQDCMLTGKDCAKRKLRTLPAINICLHELTEYQREASA
jgi:hypothetical protein